MKSFVQTKKSMLENICFQWNIIDIINFRSYLKASALMVDKKFLVKVIINLGYIEFKILF